MCVLRKTRPNERAIRESRGLASARASETGSLLCGPTDWLLLFREPTANGGVERETSERAEPSDGIYDDQSVEIMACNNKPNKKYQETLCEIFNFTTLLDSVITTHSSLRLPITSD